MGADFVVPSIEKSKERSSKALFHLCLTVLCFPWRLQYQYSAERNVYTSTLGDRQQVPLAQN